MNAVYRIDELTEKLIGTGLSYDSSASLARSLHSAYRAVGKFSYPEFPKSHVLDRTVLTLPEYVTDRLSKWGGMTESEADAYVSAFTHFARECGERARS